MSETWKDVKGFKGYYKVSNLGRVKSLKRKYKNRWGGFNTVKEKILKPIDSNGYKCVRLSKKAKLYLPRVHRLLAIAFIPNPKNKKQVNHINGIKGDNRLENIEWATASENLKHAYKLGLIDISSFKNPNSKLRKEDVNNIKKLFSKGLTVGDILDKYPVKKSTLYYIRSGKYHA